MSKKTTMDELAKKTQKSGLGTGMTSAKYSSLLGKKKPSATMPSTFDVDAKGIIWVLKSIEDGITEYLTAVTAGQKPERVREMIPSIDNLIGVIMSHRDRPNLQDTGKHLWVGSGRNPLPIRQNSYKNIRSLASKALMSLARIYDTIMSARRANYTIPYNGDRSAFKITYFIKKLNTMFRSAGSQISIGGEMILGTPILYVSPHNWETLISYVDSGYKSRLDDMVGVDQFLEAFVPHVQIFEAKTFKEKMKVAQPTLNENNDIFTAASILDELATVKSERQIDGTVLVDSSALAGKVLAKEVAKDQIDKSLTQNLVKQMTFITELKKKRAILRAAGLSKKEAENPFFLSVIEEKKP